MLLRKELFWEFDVSKMDLERDYRTVIPRVAMRGNVADIRFLLKHYPMEKILDALLNARYLDKLTLSLFSTLLEVPKEQFRCYTHAQCVPNFWDY
jgi:hypothetical protein